MIYIINSINNKQMKQSKGVKQLKLFHSFNKNQLGNNSNGRITIIKEEKLLTA